MAHLTEPRLAVGVWRWIGAAALVAALIAGALFAARDGTPAAQAQSSDTGNTSESTVSVEGVAARAVKPDQASIQYSVRILDSSASAAVGEGAAALSRIVRALAREDITEDNLQTTSVSLREEFDWTEEGRVSVGFRYTNSVRLVADGADRAGRLLDVISAAGDDQVQIDRVGFEVSNRAQIEREVVLNALDDARANADAIASHLGLVVDRVLSVSVISSFSPVVEQSGESSAQEDAIEADVANSVATPTYSGQEAISARVAITYSLAE